MNRTLCIIVLLSLSLALAGCAGKKEAVKPGASPGETISSSAGTTSGAAGAQAGTAQALSGAGSAEAAALAKTAIYFDFDSSEIRPEFVATIAAHGRKLAGDHTLKVRLEGNTDERGSAEYNVALGERRAQAVKRALLLQGATEAELSTVSYGEERPVAAGHDEQAWAQNRRVDIVYLGAR
ncbi:MAG TPA: peptidoglycan-associated lipoprotein Pal [Steroidobacteraceae bacterium]|nr:peptidoglycan-associated lipoprotein Pal [Steroidobacteraceae bacterium]